MVYSIRPMIHDGSGTATFTPQGRKRGNILATNAGDETFRVALDALKIRANTGRNTVGHAVVGVPIPLSRR